MNDALLFRESRPHAKLRPWIRSYYLLASPPGARGVSEGLLVPDGHLEIGFNLGGRRLERTRGRWSERARHCVDDVLRDVRLVHWEAPIRYVGVKFRYGAGLALLGVATEDVARDPLALADLGDDGFARLADVLGSGATWPETARAIDRFILGRVQDSPPDRLVAAASVAIRFSAGSTPISSLAEALGVSRRTLELRVKSEPGFHPSGSRRSSARARRSDGSASILTATSAESRWGSASAISRTSSGSSGGRWGGRRPTSSGRPSSSPTSATAFRIRPIDRSGTPATLSRIATGDGRTGAVGGDQMRSSLTLALLMAGLPGAASSQDVSTGASDATPPTEAEWRTDIEFVAKHLVENHVAPFHTTSESDFRAATAELLARVGEASDAELVVGLSRLVASIGDAHTYLRLPAEGPLAFRPYPVRFDWSADGLIVGSAAPSHARLVAARVISLDGTPADSAFRVASHYLYRENPITARIAAPRVLSLAEAAAGIGVAASPDSLVLELELPDGERETVTLRPLDTAPEDRVEPHGGGVPAPLHLRNRDRNFWLQRLDDRDAWYVQFNLTRDSEEETMAAFAARLADSLVARPAEDVILDLRWNVGGNSAATVPLVRTLVAQRERAPDTGFFIVIGRRSLSATIVLLGDLTRMLDPVIVGEPTGARPNLYGENPFSERAPNNGLEFTWATQYFQPFGPEPQPEAVLPHVAAEPTAADLLAGRDPALEAIAAYTPYDLAGELRAAYADGGLEAAVATYEAWRTDPKNAWRRPFDIVRRFGNQVGETAPEDAEVVFRLLRRDYPDRARTYEVLGSVAEDLGRPDEARDHYREALLRLDDDPTVSRPLAYALRGWLEERLAGL